MVATVTGEAGVLGLQEPRTAREARKTERVKAANDIRFMEITSVVNLFS